MQHNTTSTQPTSQQQQKNKRLPFPSPSLPCRSTALAVSIDMGVCASSQTLSGNEKNNKRRSSHAARRSSIGMDGSRQQREQSNSKSRSSSLTKKNTAAAKPLPPPQPPTRSSTEAAKHLESTVDAIDAMQGGDDMSYLLEAEELQRELDRVLHFGIHCDDCKVCPIEGSTYVYQNKSLTTLCKKCVNGDQAPSDKNGTKCTTLSETLSCLLDNSGLLSDGKQLSKSNFIKFWKLKYPEMPDYQVNALVASIDIQEGVQDIHSDTFLSLWLSLSSDDSTVLDDITHRQLECHSHEQCQQPFGATPILGYAYVCLDKESVLQSYCERCFRSLKPNQIESRRKTMEQQTRMYERCRTEQESMSAAFRLGAAKSKKTIDDWVKEMDKQRVVEKISLVAFGKLHGYTEDMSKAEMDGLRNHLHMQPGAQTMDFEQFCSGCLVLTGAHETPTLGYQHYKMFSNLVSIGSVVAGTNSNEVTVSASVNTSSSNTTRGSERRRFSNSEKTRFESGRNDDGYVYINTQQQEGDVIDYSQQKMRASLIHRAPVTAENEDLYDDGLTDDGYL